MTAASVFMVASYVWSLSTVEPSVIFVSVYSRQIPASGNTASNKSPLLRLYHHQQKKRSTVFEDLLTPKYPTLPFSFMESGLEAAAAP